MRRLAMAAALLALTAPAFADRASEDAMLAKARDQYFQNSKMEKDAIAASQGRVTRRGATLLLQLAGHKPEQRTDNRPACSDENPQFDTSECVRYTLVADLPTRHAYLVARSGYEGCPDLLLIDDRSGHETVFAEAPVFSPDGQRLLIQNECEMDGSISDNHFEIWRRTGDVWQLEWGLTDKQIFAADPTIRSMLHSQVIAWTMNQITLALSTEDWFSTKDSQRHPERRWTGTLIRQGDRWVLKAGALHSP